MTDTAQNGGPAFPHSKVYIEGGAAMVEGMSLRQWYAGQALRTCLAEIARIPAPEGWTHEQTAALMAFRSADAMLAEEQKPDPLISEMLEALKAMVALARPYMRDDAQMIGLAEASAAIAKAEGKGQ